MPPSMVNLMAGIRLSTGPHLSAQPGGLIEDYTQINPAILREQVKGYGKNKENRKSFFTFGNIISWV